MTEKMSKQGFFPFNIKKYILKGDRVFSLLCGCNLEAAECQKEIDTLFSKSNSVVEPGGGYIFMDPRLQKYVLSLVNNLTKGAHRGERNAIVIHFDWPCANFQINDSEKDAAIILHAAVMRAQKFLTRLCYIVIPIYYLVHVKEGQSGRKTYICLA